MNDLIKTSESSFDKSTEIISKHLSTNQTIEFKTERILVLYQKNNVSMLKTKLNMSDGELNLPSSCDLFSNTGLNCESGHVLQKVNYLLFI